MNTIADYLEHSRLPLIVSPMFLISRPPLIKACMAQKTIAAFPSLNARTLEELDRWLTELTQEHQQTQTPYAVNLIVHPTNPRLEQDLDLCVKHKVPLIITSLSAPSSVVPKIHKYGGAVFHDVATARHAQKAIEASVDGLILIGNGAGGHGGALSPFALVGEVRNFYSGPIGLGGALTKGRDILAAKALSCDFAYMGTRFIASTEAEAPQEYKNMIVTATAKDIIYTPAFTGIPGNYLIPSITNAGYNIQDIPLVGDPKLQLFKQNQAKKWKDIWGAGQGVGNIQEIAPVSEILKELEEDYKHQLHALYQS